MGAEKVLNVGVVGLGWMGKLHLRVYSELAGVNVVGVVDTNEEALKEVKDQYDVSVYTDLDELLKNDLDAISVCVPTVYHLPVGLKALEAGVTPLIEKPMAASADEARQLLAKAEEKGLQIMIGHIERFNPAVQRLKELVQEDDVISIQIERVGPYPPRIQDVGVMRDLGSHDIDLIRFITGSEYKHAFAVTSTTIGEHEDTALITAEMENGVLAHVNTNWVTPYKSRFIHIATKDRYIEANLITQQVKAYSKFEGYDAHYSIKEWPVMYREPARSELSAFLEGVRNDTPMPISGLDGLKVLETIEILEKSTC